MLFLKLFNFIFLKINPFALKTAKSSFQFTHFAVNQYIKVSPPPLFQGHISHNAYLLIPFNVAPIKKSSRQRL